MYTILVNVIDDGFANKVSIDSVIAYGSYIPMILDSELCIIIVWQNDMIR